VSPENSITSDKFGNKKLNAVSVLNEPPTVSLLDERKRESGKARGVTDSSANANPAGTRGGV
jgi:hypothetical protein